MADKNNKGTPSSSFVRVRPFVNDERTTCPKGSPVPREVVTWDGKHTITILDPEDAFYPRDNGTFNPVDVLWGFQDDEGKQQKLSNQKDVYDTVVRPNIKSIVEGYNAAFCVAGASNSGRFYTLYGDSVDGPNRGILPRFAEDIFEAFDKQRQDNSTICAEVEVIDISNENYVDVLAPHRARATSVTSGDDTLKLQNGPQGMRLSGAKSIELSGPAQLRTILLKAMRVIRKSATTHTVSIRFTETFEFSDPEQSGAPVSKSRRVQVLFVLLRSPPAAFQRVFDVAVEHDSGENPNAKVPVRETALTKLFPDLFQQGFNLSFVSCISPFFQHMRDTMTTMQFSMKVSKLRGKPKLSQDKSLIAMRRLDEEVKDLKLEARKHSAAATLVQRELNAREVQLMKQEAEHNRVSQEVVRTKKELATLTAKRKSEQEANEALYRELDAAANVHSRVKVIEDKIAKQNENTQVYERRLQQYKDEEDAVKYTEIFNLDSPGIQERKIIENSSFVKGAQNELNAIKKEEKDVLAPGETDKRINSLQTEYNKASKEEAPRRERAALEAEIARLEKEIADTEAETKRLQAEVDQKGAQCACRIM